MSSLDNITKNPNVLFYIKRSKVRTSRQTPDSLQNQNIVVYEALLTKDAIFDQTTPLDAYWMDIDPEFIAKNRARGKLTDREELNMFERKMAYGFSAENRDGCWNVALTALPARSGELRVVNDRPRMVMDINGAPAMLTSIYVKSKERMLGIPKVEYIMLYGEELATGRDVEEKLVQ